jgi:hypothetical protein
MKLKPLLLPLIVVTIITAVVLYWRSWLHEERAAEAVITIAPKPRATAAATQHPAPLPRSTTIETAHYAITTTAGDEETRLVGEAVENLYTAYAAFFAARHSATTTNAKLQLTLYKHQGEFKANNRSIPWAEAYYLRPVCYAYYARGEANPYHWMVHEATHQLNTEVASLKKAKWIDEGLATYFGTSRIERGKLLPGRIDPHTYPIWWLSDSELTGDLDADIKAGRWIPIRALITGKDAPNIASNVNRYYIQYWSLSHFLFQGENGRYADAYRQLIAEGGSLANFEKRIGPADKIEYEWYRYLRGKTAELAPQSSGDEATTVVWSR